MSCSRYRKISLLGAGSFGEAWLVKSVQSERQYVIKEMKMMPNLSQQVSIL
jgi:serine/threonine protein kinase